MTLANVRFLRKNLTDAERKLWQVLRAKRFSGYKFKRQQPIGKYIVDFVCLRQKLVLEIDGGQHSENVVRDSDRTKWLEQEGFRVIRFWNNEVLINRDEVTQVILEKLNHPLLGPLPSRERKEGAEEA